VPSEIVKRLGKKVGRQRAMVAEGHLLLILHGVPDLDSKARVGVFFWRKPSGEWESTARGGGLNSLRQHINDYCVVEEKFGEMFWAARRAEDYFDILQGLAPLHHASVSLFDALQAAREGVPEDQDIIDLRDQAYDLQRTLELAYSNAKVALDYHMAKKAEEEARASAESVKAGNRLNTLAAIFFPLMTLASVFGMNLKSGFEDWPIWMFWLTLSSGIVLGVVVQRCIARKGR